MTQATLALFVVLLGQTASGAAPASLPTEAEKLYQQGAAKYRLGEFNEAVQKFRAALALANRPSLLFNIAQCYRQLGRREQAVFYYKLYLSESERLTPNTAVPFEAEVKRRLREMEAAAAASRVAARPPAAPVSAAPSVNTVDARAAPSCPAIYKRWWFWTLLGAAVAGAVTSTVLALQPEAMVAPTGSIPPGRVELK